MTGNVNLGFDASVDAAKLNGYVQSARTAIKNYKKTAMTSAACCYLVWWYTSSEHADAQAASWLDHQITSRNAVIESFNDNLPTLKARVAEYNAGEAGEITAEELAEIKPYLGYDDAKWAGAEKRKIEAREGASTYTEVVKFVFEFDLASDAPNISRYAKVLEFIAARHEQLVELTEDAIVDLLDNVGGFEAALLIARGNEDASDNGDDGGDVSTGDAKRAAKVEALKAAIGNSAPLHSITYDPKFARDGYVFFIGHKQDDKVAVYGEIDVSENEANALVLKVDTDLIGGLDPFAEFAAKVTEIGNGIVREGSNSAYTVDDTSSGEKLKVARAYALCDDADGNYVQVSARYTDASAVVIARPKSGINIGTLKPKQYLMLPAHRAATDTVTKTGKDLAKQLGGIGDRILLKLEAVNEVSNTPVIWQVGSTTQEKTPAQNVPQFRWGIMAQQKVYPVCVDRFRDKFCVTLAKTDLQKVREEYTDNWKAADKGEKKVFIPLELSYDGISLTFNHWLRMRVLGMKKH